MDIDGLERRNTEDARLNIVREEDAFDVVTREAPDGLSQVVRAEREEVSFFSEIFSGHCCTRKLDHCTDGDTGQVNATLGCDLGDNVFALFADQLELADGADQRNHDFRLRGQATGNEFSGCLAECAHLQGEQAGQVNAEADATQAEHRVLLVEATNLSQHLLVSRISFAGRLRNSNLDFQLGQCRHELVERRVNQADGHRLAIHDLEHLEEVLLLELFEFAERCGAFLRARCGEDCALNQWATCAEEHVLGTAETDAFSAELDRATRVGRGVSVGADTQATNLVGALQDLVNGLNQFLGAFVVAGSNQASFEAVR